MLILLLFGVCVTATKVASNNLNLAVELVNGREVMVNNLTVEVVSGKESVVNWLPLPPTRKHNKPKFILELKHLRSYASLTESQNNIVTSNTSYRLADLTPGASYEVQLFTVGKKSRLYHQSSNFTMKPNAPGRFIIWVRNETTLRVLCEPPRPAHFH